jgi:integrase
MDEKKKIFAYVKETTRIASELGMIEKAKAGKSVSDKTKADYEKIGARRLDLNRKELGSLMEGVTAASWHKTRAALNHVLAARYIQHKRERDDAQKAGDWDQVKRSAVLARRTSDAYSKIGKAERPAPEKKRATKRRTLPKSDDWQARVYEVASPAQRGAVALIWATGCRPAEVETGARIEMRKNENDGQEYLLVTICGAKVSEHSGQLTRYFLIDPESESGRALVEQMSGAKSINIQRPAKRINKDFEKIRGKTGYKVSPYSLRHQLSANLKAEWGPGAADLIATAMGHAVTRSQGRYGSVRQAQSDRSGILDIKATRPIKETRSAPKKPGPETSTPALDPFG